jgi:predicted  nucleic acid-binding Zn-ribbon protein
MDTRLKIDERLAVEEGVVAENESLKTDIDAVAKQNVELQKAIAELKKVQAELLAAQQAEIERLESLVPEVHEDEEITDVHLEEEAEEVPTVTTLDNGRVQLRIPL